MHNLAEISAAGVQSGAHQQVRTYNDFYETKLHIKSPEMQHIQNMVGIGPLQTEDGHTPFIMRLLAYRNPYFGAKFEGKDIVFSQKPKWKKEVVVPIPPVPAKQAEYSEDRWLSGGQWQRIALARAFMKIQEAELLLLDEPSSALDPQAEYEVFKTIMELRKGKTTIYIVYPILTLLIQVTSVAYSPGCIQDIGILPRGES
jgi:ABC-type transport system involved in Fe-S cluster assembly fused permease/ATPase subunit